MSLTPQDLADINENGTTPAAHDSTAVLLAKAVLAQIAPVGECAIASAAYTNSSNISAGAWQIQCQNTGAADGVFAGAVVPAGKFAAPLTAPPGCLLPAVSYNATGTTLVITTARYS